MSVTFDPVVTVTVAPGTEAKVFVRLALSGS